MIRDRPLALSFADSGPYLTAAKKTWPQEAGLLQLVEVGALTPCRIAPFKLRMADSNSVVGIGFKKVQWKGGDNVVREAGLNYTQEELGR